MAHENTSPQWRTRDTRLPDSLHRAIEKYGESCYDPMDCSYVRQAEKEKTQARGELEAAIVQYVEARITQALAWRS